MSKSSNLDIALWFLLAFSWATSFSIIKIGIETISPLILVCGRMLIGAMVLTFFAYASSVKLPMNLNALSQCLVIGLMGNVIPFLLISYGETFVESGLAALLMGIGPIATISLAPFLIKEEPFSNRQLLACALGIAGLICLVGPNVVAGLGNHIVGQFSILGAAICYALSGLYTRKYVKLPARAASAGSITIGAIIINLYALVTMSYSNLSSASFQSIMAMIYLGLIPTALAALLYFHLIPKLGATTMSYINFLVPLMGVLIGIVALSEPITISKTLALCLILIAVGVAVRAKPSKAT